MFSKTTNWNCHRRLQAIYQDVKQYAFLNNSVIHSLSLQDELLIPSCWKNNLINVQHLCQKSLHDLTLKTTQMFEFCLSFLLQSASLHFWGQKTAMGQFSQYDWLTDNLRFDTQHQQEISLLSSKLRTALGPTELSVQWVPMALFLESSNCSMKLTTHLHQFQGEAWVVL